ASAVTEQFLISARIALADLFWHMGEVEFDRPAAARFEVYEQRPVLRVKHVARVRLAVQQLLARAAVADRAFQAPQRVAQQLPVGFGERRREFAARNESLSLG